MQIADTQYKEGRRAGVVQPTMQFKLGGVDFTPALDTWEVDRSYNTDLPPAMRAFSGSSAAQFKFKVSNAVGDKYKSAPALYGPWAPRATADVMRPNQSVTFKYGYNGSNLAAFRGTIRNRSASSGANQVQGSALDGAERLRSAAIVPRPFITTAWDQWVLSPSLLVDNLLRDAGIYSSPPPRFDNLLFVSGHDGVFPYRGQYILSSAPWTTTRTNPPFTAMAVPQGAPSGSSTVYIPRKRVTENGLNSSFWMEFFTSNSTFMGFATKKIEISLTFTPVDPAYSLGTGTYKWTIDYGGTAGPSAGNQGLSVTQSGGPGSGLGSNFDTTQFGTYHHSIFMNPNAGTGVVDVQLRTILPNKDVIFTSLTTMPAYTASYDRYLEYVTITSINVPFENVQVCKTANTQPAVTYADTTQAGQWVRGARFPDANLFPLSYLPNVTGSKWDVISEIARATLATAEFNENGIFYWREHTRFSSPSASTLVTSEREMSALTISEQIDACRNFIQVTNQDFSGYPSSSPTKLFASTGNPSIAAGSSLSFVFPIDADFEFDPTTIPRIAYAIVSSGNWVTPMNVASGGTVSNIVKTDVEIEGYHNESKQFVVTVHNMSGSTIWLYKAGGSGSGVLMEIPYDDTGFSPKVVTSTQQNTTSQAWYGKQAYEHDAGPWIQGSGASGNTLATALLNAGAFPIPVMEDVEIIPDARLQLGDVVKVVDRVGAPISQDAWIIGINTSGDSGGVLKQRLTLRGTAYPGTPTDTGLTPEPPVDPVAGSTA